MKFIEQYIDYLKELAKNNSNGVYVVSCPNDCVYYDSRVNDMKNKLEKLNL